MNRGRVIFATVVSAVITITYAACSTTPSTTTPFTTRPTVTRHVKVTTPTVKPTHRTSSHATPTPTAPLPAGGVFPDRLRTPGAYNPAVTQATVMSTICVVGWTSTVRPSASYTSALKRQQLAAGYTYHGDVNPRDYEEDHLVPLELGGAPSDVRNLWPEPYHVTDGARTKDLVENRLHELVCEHVVTLAVARRAITTNWLAAYVRYVQ